jgi:chromosome segregation protein
VYLKSLKVVGFKSFADRTRLEFRPGVTVVVGPNGSGKSNLVDALSWVMGSQSTRALRTGRMEDVVFAGTATRPPLNRAEATLVIDNAARVLPLDLDEIALTRRLYRDGSSDYEINGIGCRLLDIQELLSDSGIGRHQHVIIGQGQVDSVLNASPEEHRAVIEEAAGILKHRQRKEKAERRLERTDEDLVRLEDLIGEMERQIRPLRRQARAAERYDGLKTEVRELVLHLSGVTLGEYDEEITQNGGRLEELRLGISHDEEIERRLGVEMGELAGRAALVGSDLERDSSAAALLETIVERMRRLGAVAHERARAAAGRMEASVERRTDLEAERTGILVELEELAGARSEAKSLVEAHEADFRRLEDQERAITTQNALSPEGALAAVRGELAAMQAAGSRDLREIEAIERRLDVVISQLGDESSQIARINEEIKEIDRDVVRLQTTYQTVAKKSSADQEKWQEAEEGLAAARLDLAAAEATAGAIEAAIAGRFDLEARKSVEDADGAIGGVLTRLDIPPGLEKACDAALGRWADAVAFVDTPSMRDAVETVKGAGGGGVPVVAPTTKTVGAHRTDLGVDALVDLLGSGADRGLAERLLGDVLLVQGWAEAWRLVNRNPDLRAVTPDGDLITQDGIQMAHPDEAGPAMLEAAEVDVERTRTALSRALSIHVAAKRDFETARVKERLALEELEAVEVSLAGRTEAMARIQNSVDALDHEAERLRHRSSAIAELTATRDRDMADLFGRLRGLEGEEAARLAIWEELESRRAGMAVDRELARSAWQEAEATLTRSVERVRLLEDRLRYIVSELQRGDPVEGRASDPGPLSIVESYSRRAVEVLQHRLEELRQRQAGLRSSSQEVTAALTGARSEHDRCRDALSDSRSEIADLQIRATELRLLRQGVVEQIRREADAEVDEALAVSRPDYPADSDLTGILEEKSAQLRRLGPINPLAAVEYAELDERYRFLGEQIQDVESSRSELRKVISALEREIDERFDEAFIEVATAFQHYFSLLFPGGKGRARPADNDDPQSGVIIDAQPLGKKVSQLSLLSGGERSLAALAFLFSVFEARPSPFYVLDEVEAALDDANLRRFLRIVDEFRQRAQLLIVTHQQQTMEAADVLYGVTMEPGGSSQVIRKDMAPSGIDLTV